MWGSAAAGHRKFLHARGKGASGQNNSSPGFARFAGQRPGAQRSISGDLNFGSFFQEKEQALPAANERANVMASTK
jgi:hypothetical protein